MKKDRAYIVFVAGLFVLFISLLLLQPDSVSWNPTFTKKDKLPFASRAVFERLQDIFPDRPVEAVYVPAAEFEKEWDEEAVAPAMNYILVRQKAVYDEFDRRAICRLAAAGNHVFIAGGDLDDAMGDTLGFLSLYESWKGQSVFGSPDTLRLNFEHPLLHTEKGYAMRPGENDRYIAVADSVKDVEILGTNSQGDPVFVKKQMGRGAIYFHCVPLAFTNYYLLRNDNAGYISRCFSYLPQAPVYWDEYYKVGRQEAATPLRVVLQHPALKTALVLTLVLVLLYMLFQGKRRQRVIPVIPPFENSTLQFVATVARLYHNRGEHTSLAHKKALYFVERLRVRYQVAVDLNDEESILAVSARSGVDVALTRAVFRFTHHIKTAADVSQKELIGYNNKIEEFWRHAT